MEDLKTVANITNHDSLTIEFHEGVMVFALCENMEPVVFIGEDRNWRQVSKEEIHTIVKLLEVLRYEGKKIL